MKPLTAAQRKAELAAIRKSIETLEQGYQKDEFAFHLKVLPTRVKQGLHCYKAHMLFAVQPDKRKGIGGRSKTVSTVDTVSPQGFEGWLETEMQWLKRPTAYRYMTAFKGLLLDETATEADVDAALAALIARLEKDGLQPPSLKFLCSSAVDLIAPPADPESQPDPTEQMEFTFLKSQLTKYREFTDTLLNLKDQLAKNPDFARAASSRAYHVLHELTGQHWTPSDDPNELANIDPDTITL